MNSGLFERTKVDLGTAPEAFSIVENGEALVELVTNERLGVSPIWELYPRSTEGRMYRQYIAEHPEYRGVYVRRHVAEILRNASRSLPKNWQLVVAAGHRPVSVQQSLYDYEHARFRTKYPRLSVNDVATMTRLYVTDPARKAPAHCCASAVDVKVVDVTTGNDIDFGTILNTSSPKSHIHSPHISQAAHDNRMVLLEAMLCVGFASLHSEWWHFSYGDQNWAAFYELPNAIYSVKDAIMNT